MLRLGGGSGRVGASYTANGTNAAERHVPSNRNFRPGEIPPSRAAEQAGCASKIRARMAASA
jgi:hypothetical protein